VTWLGSLGGLVGAATVGIASGLVTGLGVTFPLALAVGMLGMLFDSLLGATVQGRFFCDACGVATERRHHRCGRAARHTGGTRWITNDVVNAMATGAAAILGWMAWWLAGPRALAP
jgi:uncharacterized membrane protein